MAVLGKLLLISAACMFMYAGYQSMIIKTMYQQKDVVMSTTTGGDSTLTSLVTWQLVLATILAVVGGMVTRGPLKPISIADSPSITGEYPEFRDFLSCSTRGSILGALLRDTHKAK
jgi:hypothetical protein